MLEPDIFLTHALAARMHGSETNVALVSRNLAVLKSEFFGKLQLGFA